MTFEAKQPIDYYLGLNWKLVPPSKQKCPKCQKPIISSPDSEFMYCPICDVKLVYEKQAPREDITSQLLLQQYCMLNDSCPIQNCYSPLMRSPDKSFVTCGACGYKGDVPAVKQQVVNVDKLVQDAKRRVEQSIKGVQNKFINDENLPTLNVSSNQDESILDLLKLKINILSEKLIDEEDINQIILLTSAIKGVFEVVEKIEMM
ncbi:hypothetical protein SS50377_22865 [Spironucleus salmonicida]|uniref:Uncharacterized protein n=1 Tax=Spironucleus salmonicida TaxID=348837 RepID=V6LYD3_9EUKA|nr:hypothetical protein SS50377_22865 [Spironucleus salmonicida]|eukprot:EST48716.1 Hypothetical protein SS50377_11031 [Spironucleus salmonicida]